MGTERHNWHLDLAHEQWVALPVSGPRPLARYKHAATLVDDKLYIAGGSRNGRYLTDIQVFDLRNLTWSTIKLNVGRNADNSKGSGLQEVISGHNMIKWDDKLLLLSGHSKNISESVKVWYINLKSHLCDVVETSGKVPVARGGQSVSLVGSRLVMFGGEDRHGSTLNDVHVLDLDTMTWTVVETTQAPPAPRFDHAAAVHAERYLLIFGGCSHSIFFNDLHLLDLETMEWSQPQVQGDLVTPRAGHAGIAIDENWYIVGGGDNTSGAPETIVLNMSKLALSVVTSVKGRDPLASEGLSISSAFVHGEKFLVAFGGYNGKYNNEVFVMRLKAWDSLQSKIFKSAAAAAAAASVNAAYALAKSEMLNFSIIEEYPNSMVDLSFEINAIREGKRMLESSLVEVRAENSALKAKLEETNSTFAELSKELHCIQGQLAAERSRCAKLEGQILELQKVLESVQTIEEDVKVLRRQKSEFENDMERTAMSVKRQSSGGIWRRIAG
ncbi:hypothetical protein LguiA_016747 [Lonicera macranthoides]